MEYLERISPQEAEKEIMKNRCLQSNCVVEGNLIIHNLPPGIIMICGFILGEMRICGVNEAAIIWNASCARSVNISGHLRKAIRFGSKTRIDNELQIDAVAFSKVIVESGSFISKSCLLRGEFLEEVTFGGRTGELYLSGMFEKDVEISEGTEISRDIYLYGVFTQGIPRKIKCRPNGHIYSRSGMLL